MDYQSVQFVLTCQEMAGAMVASIAFVVALGLGFLLVFVREAREDRENDTPSTMTGAIRLVGGKSFFCALGLAADAQKVLDDAREYAARFHRGSMYSEEEYISDFLAQAPINFRLAVNAARAERLRLQ